MSKEPAIGNRDELRERVLAELKHAYFNSTTDNLALRNGVTENRDHALPTLEGKADTIMAAIDAYTIEAEKRAELRGRLDEITTTTQRLSDLERRIGFGQMVKHIKAGNSSWDLYVPEREAELKAQLNNLNTKEGE